jgi:hypothetical protein
MAHQLGGFYDLPHGVCNAVLLPHVQAYNKQVAAGRLGDIARAMGENVDGLDDDAAAERCLAAIRRLSADIGIPSGLTQLGVQTKDFPTLTANALKDVCGLTNPIHTTSPGSQHEPQGGLLGQCRHGALLPESQDGACLAASLRQPHRSQRRHWAVHRWLL